MSTPLTRLLRRHYIDLQGYVSAGMEVQKDDSTVFLNANENPFPLPGLEGYNRYPEPQPQALLEGYAKLYGVRPGNIVATRGADEAITIITRLFCEPGEDSILITSPTFGIYSVQASAMPGKVIDVPLLQKNNRFELDVEGIKKHLNGKDIPRIIYLCTPNNPTANLLKQEDVEAVCDAAKDKSVIVVDETYLEFSGHESMIKHMRDNPNIIVLRTLSKSFALAGQRMGCLISSDEKFIQLVRSKGMEIYPLPRGSVEAALKVLQPDMLKLAEKNRGILIAERKRLEKNFTGNTLILQVYDSDANFLLVRMKRAKEFTAHCAKNKIILRDFSDKPHTQDCLRITVGTPEQNDKLMSLLKNFSEQ